VQEEAVVVLAPPAEDDRLAVAEEIVREAEARLPFILVGLALRTGREIVVGDGDGSPFEGERLPFKSRDDFRGSDIVLVEHVGLVIPSQAEIQREVAVDGPAVLTVEAVLIVRRGKNRIADAEL